MIRQRGGSTSALLQKASSQLKGERVIQVSEEDDLNAYISSLAKRTTTKKSVDIDVDSDISISNEDYQYGGAPVSNSRYLKKKVNVQDSLDSVESLDPRDTGPQRFVKKTVPQPGSNYDLTPGTTARPVTSRGPANRSPRANNFSNTTRAVQRQSAALNKAQALSDKISERPIHVPSKRSNVFTLETDSEDSFHRPTASSYKHARTPSPMRSASDSSMSLGKDGGKFVRKKIAPPAPPEFLTAHNTEPKRPATNELKRPNTAVPGAKGRRKLVGNVMLSSEEESLAEFIEGLSGSDMSQRASSPTKPRSAVLPVQRSPSPDSKPPLRQTSSYSRPSHRQRSSPKSSVLKRTSSPPSQSHLLTRSVSEESLPSQTQVDSVSYEEEDGDFKVNVVMDLDTLGPVMSLDLEEEKPAPREQKTKLSSSVASPFYKSSNNPDSRHKSPDKRSSIYSTKKLKKVDSKKHLNKSKPEIDLLNSFGLHTVDELLGQESKDSSKEMSVVSDISEILTEKQSNIFRAKQPVNDSVTEGYSELDTKPADEPVSYSVGFESISEKIGEVSSSGEAISEVKTEYSGEESKNRDDTYTEDFTSQSETAPDSDTHSYTSNTSSQSYTPSSVSGVPERPSKAGKKSVEVQTGDQPGLTYQWNMHHSGMAFMGPSFGMAFTDPTPIAAHTVSPEALEALSSYSPAMLALHDMLKQQLELTQTFVQAQQYLYNSYTRSIEPEHKYTTLEDTKQYIRKHRKPRLSFKEALKLVDKEMT